MMQISTQKYQNTHKIWKKNWLILPRHWTIGKVASTATNVVIEVNFQKLAVWKRMVDKVLSLKRIHYKQLDERHLDFRQGQTTTICIGCIDLHGLD